MDTPKQGLLGGFKLYRMTKILYKMTNLLKMERGEKKVESVNDL